jgi:hypothetical protein
MVAWMASERSKGAYWLKPKWWEKEAGDGA